MQTVVGLVLAAVAVGALASATLPGRRTGVTWRGSREPIGRVARAGFGLAFGAVGVQVLSQGLGAPLPAGWLLAPVGLGVLLVAAGQWCGTGRPRWGGPDAEPGPAADGGPN